MPLDACSKQMGCSNVTTNHGLSQHKQALCGTVVQYMLSFHHTHLHHNLTRSFPPPPPPKHTVLCCKFIFCCFVHSGQTVVYTTPNLPANPNRQQGLEAGLKCWDRQTQIYPVWMKEQHVVLMHEGKESTMQNWEGEGSREKSAWDWRTQCSFMP